MERVAGPGGGAAGALETPTRGNPARGLCVLSNYLFIEKKGGERKKRSHMSGLYVCEEKQQKEGKIKASRRRRKRSSGGSGGGAGGGGGGAAGDRHPPV